MANVPMKDGLLDPLPARFLAVVVGPYLPGRAYVRRVMVDRGGDPAPAWDAIPAVPTRDVHVGQFVVVEQIDGMRVII